jgi:hypothetical protein
MRSALGGKGWAPPLDRRPIERLATVVQGMVERGRRAQDRLLVDLKIQAVSVGEAAGLVLRVRRLHVEKTEGHVGITFAGIACDPESHPENDAKQSAPIRGYVHVFRRISLVFVGKCAAVFRSPKV